MCPPLSIPIIRRPLDTNKHKHTMWRKAIAMQKQIQARRRHASHEDFPQSDVEAQRRLEAAYHHRLDEDVELCLLEIDEALETTAA